MRFILGKALTYISAWGSFLEAFILLKPRLLCLKPYMAWGSSLEKPRSLRSLLRQRPRHSIDQSWLHEFCCEVDDGQDPLPHHHWQGLSLSHNLSHKPIYEIGKTLIQVFRFRSSGVVVKIGITVKLGTISGLTCFHRVSSGKSFFSLEGLKHFRNLRVLPSRRSERHEISQGLR